MAPASIGEKLLIVSTVSAIIVDAKVATGPITRNPAGSATKSVSIGTKKNLTRSGTNLLNSFSHFDAKYTIKITGITVEV